MDDWHEHPSSHASVHIFYHEDWTIIADSLPWDPLQWLTGNSANYHDIHHQVFLRPAFYTSLTYFQGYWHEIKFLSAPFCSLGYTSWNEDDTGRH